MGVALEIKSGAMAGKVIAVTTGRSVTVGRGAGKAEFALPQDTFMSGLHFAVECSTSGCRVVDRKSSNGTFLNGARIQDAMLANGDEIKAGQTVFAVKILSDEKLAGLVASENAAAPAAETGARRAADSSSQSRRAPAQTPGAKASESVEPPPRRTAEQPAKAQPTAPGLKSDVPPRAPGKEEPSAGAAAKADASAASSKAAQRRGGAAVPGSEAGPAAPREFAISIMGWSFPAIPGHWQVQEELGLSTDQGEFPSSVAATRESLGGITLQQFVEFQLNMLKSYLREATVEPAVAPRVSGAEEMIAVDVRHKTKDGKELVYRRIYARSGAAVGVLTVTALASELARVVDSLAPALNGMKFQPPS